MGLFDVFKKVKDAANQNLNPEYGKNKDFLEAACALSASVAYADGNCSDVERDAVVNILTNHPQLGKLYTRDDIKRTADTMFGRATTFTGRLALSREIDDIRGKSQSMAQDVYAVGLDVAMADGELADSEEKVLHAFASKLGVDVSAFS
jgi:tellurite resistance protein